MQKYIKGFILLTSLLSYSFASSSKLALQETEVKYIQITILDKGVKRKIIIPKNNRVINKFNIHTEKQLSSKDGIIICFKDTVSPSLNELEARYGLKLKKKLITGYYVFRNVSKYSDVEIVGEIIKNETTIKTVKPNWKKKNKIR